MSFVLGNQSLSRLQGVHPNLVYIVKRAILLTTQDFIVVEGVRSKQQMCVNYGKGRTADECEAKGVPATYAAPTLAKVTWLAHPLLSKHGVHDDGFGHAVDLAPWVGSTIDWNTPSRFEAISLAMLQAAHEHGVAITWGGTWITSPDLPHYELAA